MAAVMMAVGTATVGTMAAEALTLGGNCSGRGIGEEESSKGGTVLYLQALGGGVGRGMFDEPTEEGAGEGEGGILVVIADLTTEVVDSCPPC